MKTAIFAIMVRVSHNVFVCDLIIILCIISVSLTSHPSKGWRGGASHVWYVGLYPWQNPQQGFHLNANPNLG